MNSNSSYFIKCFSKLFTKTSLDVVLTTV